MLVSMEHDKELAYLRKENAELRQHLEQAYATIAELRQELAEALQLVATALARIAELEKQQPKDPPSFVKRNRADPTEPRPPRQKRASEHNHGRCRTTPTQIVQHALERCPECNYQLRGESIDYTRQVIEAPPPPPVEVIEHQIIKRWCPCCAKWRSPVLDLTGVVIGEGRLGIGLIALIAYLRSVLRVPVRLLVAYLAAMHGIKLSEGEIIEVLHRVRRATAETVLALKEEARASPVLHGDETGWRQDGRNGYIWGFFTPGEQAVRYYEYDRSRGRQVVSRMLGSTFTGHLVTDFLGSYNVYAGNHQRCWVHLLRLLHALKEKHAAEAAVGTWAQAVRAVYDAAQGWLQRGEQTREEREAQYVQRVEEIRALALPYAREKGHACRGLAKLLLRHQDELFQFVLVPGLSADNNLAERSLRPMVVIRKISGGSRGTKGTRTRMALATLFETWKARGLNPLEECHTLLSHSTVLYPETPLPQL